jgi:Zn-finger nucleic acid-binding protein
MMCQHCGAPMLLIRDRDYYFCEYCGAYHFPDSSSDGIRELGEDPERIKCPLCHIPFTLVTLDNHFRGYQCKNCRGLLFNRLTFRNTIETRRAKATTPPEPQTMVKEEDLHRRVNCPKCSQTMENHLYLGPGNVVIDTCNSCNLIWLDYGELNKVVNAPGKDRGSGMPFLHEFHQHNQDSREQGKHKKQEDDFQIDLIDLLKDILS